MPKGRVVPNDDDDDDHHPSSLSSRAPRPPPLPSVDSAESSDIHNDSYLEDDDDDDDEDYGYGRGRVREEEEDEEEILRSYDDDDGVVSATPADVILVGCNRKSAYPATPSDHDHACRTPGYHPPHPPNRHPMDIRRTPGPPNHRHPHHHGPHPQGPSHRLTPGAGAAKFQFQTPFQTPSSKPFRNPLPELIDEDYRGAAVVPSNEGSAATTPQISNRAIVDVEEPPKSNAPRRSLPADDDAPLPSSPSPSPAVAHAHAPAHSAAAPPPSVDALLQSRDRHRQKHLYTPAHVTLSKNPHLHLSLDRDGRADVLSPATIRMTESLDKVLCDEEEDDGEGGRGNAGERAVTAVVDDPPTRERVSSAGSAASGGSRGASDKGGGNSAAGARGSLNGNGTNVGAATVAGGEMGVAVDVVGEVDPTYFRHVPGIPANPALATPNASNIHRTRSNSSEWGAEAWHGPFPLTAAASSASVPTTPAGVPISPNAAFRRIPSSGSKDSDDDSDDDDEIREIGAIGTDRDIAGDVDGSLEGTVETTSPRRVSSGSQRSQSKGQRGNVPKPLNFDRPPAGVAGSGAFGAPKETPKPNRTAPPSAPVGYSPYRIPQHQHHHDHNPYFVPLNAHGGGGGMDIHGPNSFPQVSAPHNTMFPQQHPPHPHHDHYPHHPPQHHPFAPSPPTIFPHHPAPGYHHAPEPFHAFPPFSQPPMHSSHPYGHPILSPLTIPTEYSHDPAHLFSPPAATHHPADPRGWSPVPPPFAPVVTEDWNPMRGHPHHHYPYGTQPGSHIGMGVPGHSSPELAFHPIAGHISPDPSTSLSVSPAPFLSHPPYRPPSNYPPHPLNHQPHPHPPMIHQPTPVPARHPPPHRNSPNPHSPIKRGGASGGVGRGTHTPSSSSGERTERPRKDSLSSMSAGEEATSKSSPRRNKVSPSSRYDLRETGEAGIEACTWMPPQPNVVWTGRKDATQTKYGNAGWSNRGEARDWGTDVMDNPTKGRGKGRGRANTMEGDIHVDKKSGKRSNLKQTRDRKHPQQSNHDAIYSKTSRSGISTSLGAGVRVDDDAKRGEFTESPAERQAFKEFGRNFRQKENVSLEAARKYAMSCLSATNPDLHLPPSTHWRVYLELADIAKRSNQLDDARSHYRRSCELQPYASQGWLEHSKLEEECGNLSTCANILEEGLQFCSLNESLLIRAVKFYERIGDLRHARQLLARLKHSSVEKSWKTMLEGALLEARAGKYKMARELLKYITFHVPWYGPLYLAHTKLERDYGSPEEAYLIVEKGLKELPRYGPLYFQAFHLCEKEDLSNEDFHLPRTMAVVSRADSISKELLWKVHLEVAQIQERAAIKAVEYNPTLNLTSELQSARKSYAKSIMLCPPNLTWKVWLASGRTNISCDNIDEARTLFLRAYDCVSEKSKSTVLLECARLEEFCGDVELARSILCKARNESGKNDWKVWLSSVNLESRCGHRERAIMFAQRALNIHSGTGRLWAALIQLKHEDGELQQMKVLRKALEAVPKSGEVWCEGARIHLNPFSPTFDMNSALRHLTFAARFTPQYGDSFLEHIRLDMIDQWLIPLATPFINTMYNSFLSGGKMQLDDSYQVISQHTRKAAEEIKLQLKESVPFDKDVLDTSELELRCSSADPNYGHLWFQCRESPIDTAREVIARARLKMTEDFTKYSFIYVAAMVRRAGILMTIYHCDKIITPPDEKCGQRLAPAASDANEESIIVNIDAIITSRLRTAPLLEEMLSGQLTHDGICVDGPLTKASTAQFMVAGPMFVTGIVTSSRTWENLSFSEKRQILFGTDSLLN